MTPDEMKQLFIEVMQPKEFIRVIFDNSLIFWLILLAFCVGIFVGSVYYEAKCNSIISDIEEEINGNTMLYNPISYDDSLSHNKSIGLIQSKGIS